ncbi:MAG: hypothetical protein KVP17_001937 [Porospora cf. gigantea B]|uniref:uncharacterized protein n=1 Tax=Porospora cf. gigantea B TaxID=2853592 RepID=UPI0035719E35|nr:MAG: hypothetical protein KVP17_001937 [Porospora cf. gigantea B]
MATSVQLHMASSGCMIASSTYPLFVAEAVPDLGDPIAEWYPVVKEESSSSDSEPEREIRLLTLFTLQISQSILRQTAPGSPHIDVLTTLQATLNDILHERSDY